MHRSLRCSWCKFNTLFVLIKLSKDLPGPACWGRVLCCCPSGTELLPVLILQRELSGVMALLSLLPCSHTSF